MMRWIKRLALAVILLLVLVVLGVGAILLTPVGVKLAVWGAQKALPELKIEKGSGALLNGFALDGVTFDMDGVSVSAKSLYLDVNSKCLSGPAICIDALNADGLKVNVGDTGPSEETPPSEPITSISTPIPIFLNGVSLTDIDLDILGNKVHWDSLTTAAQMQRSTLTLKPTLWQGIEVELAESKGETETTPKKASEPKQALTLPEVNIPLDVIIEHFEVKHADLLLPQAQKIHQLVLEGRAGGNEVSIKQLLLDAEQGKVELNGEVALKGEYPLTLDANADIRMKPLGGHALTLDAKGDLSALELKANLTGTLQAKLSGKLNVLEPDLPFEALLTSRNLQWPIESSPDYRLAASALRASGSLKGYRATLKTDASGKEIPDITLKTQLSGDLSKIALGNLELDTLGGEIKGSASVDWSELVKWQTALTFTDIQPGLQWPEAEGTLSGKVKNDGELTKAGGWKVNVPELDVQGDIRKQALVLKGQVSASDVKGKGDIQLDTQGLKLSHGPNEIAVTGRVNDTLDLDLALKLPSLAASVPDASGAVQGDISLSGTVKEPVATLNLTANKLRYQNLVSIADAKIRGSLKPLPLVSGGLIVDVNGIKAEGVDIQTLMLRASGTEAEQTISLNVDGKPVGAEIALRGSLDRKKGWKGKLYNSTLRTPVGPWALQNDVPLGYDLNTGKVDVGAFCWGQNQSRICLDKPISVSDSGSALVSVDKFNLDIIQSFLPTTTTLSGLVSGLVDVAWKPNALPTLKATVSLGKGEVVEQLDQPFTLGWDKVNIKAALVDEKLTADAQLDLTNNGSVMLDAEMTNLSSDKKIMKSTLGIDAISLSTLQPLLGDDGKLEGVLNGKVVLNGDLEAPTADGKITLTGLKLQSLSAPVEVRQGQIAIALNGKQGEIDGKIETPDGDLLLKGEADWRDINEWLASLNVKGQHLKVVVPPMVALEVSPDMTLKATPKQVDVTGNVSVPWGRIIVESLPPSAVQVSSDLVILNDDLKPVSEENKDPLTINAKIKVNIGDDVRLEAFGLKTNLEGKLDVQSNKKGPSVGGDVNLVDGTYSSFGQDLLIKKGLILFNGPPEQPYLQVEAIRNPDNIEDGVEAGIRVTGPADAPEVQVFSDPAMPQANALSYLTRGRNLDSESDGNAMTSMLISLGLSQSGKLVGQIGEAFGVQDLTVDTAGSGNDEKVEVSGYILPGLQVKYGVGIFTSLPEFTVRYRLIKDLYLEAVSGADNAVDLLYQFSIK
ncbi:translocation/assembly module TamB [Enterovibrio sp. ZSDZ35]|uniref:Translocation/assembly module TamB n=1 Tax=Enterovibrio qingdaonensis TaxID=2899818 RepID=A0ABT5QKU5_9GAMM|nr:translocation/assembly module TamB domain-containing protein [Enterovibrio sp. ZSDZ35]MDD1781607.1 translocation/assembly module TamB [Enterovibrio sp. ZSDZ35]